MPGVPQVTLPDHLVPLLRQQHDVAHETNCPGKAPEGHHGNSDPNQPSTLQMFPETPPASPCNECEHGEQAETEAERSFLRGDLQLEAESTDSEDEKKIPPGKRPMKPQRGVKTIQ